MRIVFAIAFVVGVAGVTWLAGADLTVAALVLLVAVLLASMFGLWSAGAAAITGFVTLNLWFTEPTGSLKIRHGDDVAALVVFALAAGLLGWTVRRLASLRAIAVGSEADARVQLELTTQLLGATDVDDALRASLRALEDIFEFSSCELRAGADSVGTGVFETPNVHITTGGVTVVAGSARELGPAERALLESLVATIAAGVDRLRLREEVRDTRLVAEIGRQRAGFLSAVSHNLRTPLTAVKAAASTLLSSWSRIEPEERRELLETIADEAERLERLVRNTLELSRIRAGALEVTPEAVDLRDLVQHAVRRLRPVMRAHRVRLDLDDHLPEMALDITMTDQILLNLLENALRFAPPGSEISVSARPVEDDRVELRVADHGPGVPSEARARIFEEFQSAETRPDRTGTGLGLAIVRALVTAQGGTVRYEDTAGGGATFVCTFPRVAERHSL